MEWICCEHTMAKHLSRLRAGHCIEWWMNRDTMSIRHNGPWTRIKRVIRRWWSDIIGRSGVCMMQRRGTVSPVTVSHTILSKPFSRLNPSKTLFRLIGTWFSWWRSWCSCGKSQCHWCCCCGHVAAEATPQTLARAGNTFFLALETFWLCLVTPETPFAAFVASYLTELVFVV